jgi:polyhydroxybutyrate depolymerase
MPPAKAVTEFVDIDVAGRARSYRLHVPEGLTDGSVYPLVLDFHGLTAGPESQDELSGMSGKADVEGFIVATPRASGIGSSWGVLPGRPETEADVAFALAIVADIGERLPVDSSRVYATGFSNGGGLANRLACDEADTFAAIGSVAGAYPSYTDCDGSEPVPVIAFHGSDDLVVPFGGLGGFLPPIADWAEAWAARNGCTEDPQQERVTEDVIRVWWEACPAGADVELYAIDGGAHGWPGSTSAPVLLNSTDTISATDLIWEFFESR